MDVLFDIKNVMFRSQMLDGVVGLWDALMVFRENSLEESPESAKISFVVLLEAASYSNTELCGTAKVHMVIQIRKISDLSVVYYILYLLSDIMSNDLKGELWPFSLFCHFEINRNCCFCSYSIQMTIWSIIRLKAVLAKLTHTFVDDLFFYLNMESGLDFYDNFQKFSKDEHCSMFLKNKVNAVNFIFLYFAF